jgi:hypothetical protein
VECDDEGRGGNPEPDTEAEGVRLGPGDEETGSADAGAEGGGWLVKENPKTNLPYTGRLLLDIVRSLVMVSTAVPSQRDSIVLGESVTAVAGVIGGRSNRLCGRNVDYAEEAYR